MIPAADVNFYGLDAFVGTMSWAGEDRGPLIGDGSVEVVRDFRNNLAGLGKAVRKALDGSRRGIGLPDNYDKLTRPYVKASGAKSWSEFNRKSVNVSIETTEEGGLKARVWGPPDRHGGRGSVWEEAEFSPKEAPERIGELLVNVSVKSGLLKEPKKQR